METLTEDTEKRGKLFTLSLLIALSVFIQTITKPEVISGWILFLIGVGYMLFVVISLTWALNFRIKFRSLIYLVYSGLFVMSEYLFIELFFIQKFSRLYEGILLFLLSLIVFLGTYASFLMVNVFNVSLYKNLPLVHVARTTSYLISTFLIYFMSFSLLAGELPIYILLPCVLLVYSFVSFTHLKNLGFEGSLLARKSILVSLISFILFLSSFLSGALHEISSLAPVVGYFAGIGLANYTETHVLRDWEKFLYVLILIIVIIFNIYFIIFS